MSNPLPQLSPVERDVLERVITGLSSTGKPDAYEIAASIGITIVEARCALARLYELELVADGSKRGHRFIGGKVSVAMSGIVSQEI